MQDMKLQDMQRQSRILAQKRQTSESRLSSLLCLFLLRFEDCGRSKQIGFTVSHWLEHTRNSLIFHVLHFQSNRKNTW